MADQEIARQDWVNFLDAFSKQHEGWLINVELWNRNTCSTEARDVPLMALAANLKHGDEDTISIITGTDQKDLLTRNIPEVVHIRTRKNEKGVDEGLYIESKDSTGAFVRFRSPVKAEQVDQLSTSR